MRKKKKIWLIIFVFFNYIVEWVFSDWSDRLKIYSSEDTVSNLWEFKESILSLTFSR